MGGYMSKTRKIKKAEEQKGHKTKTKKIDKSISKDKIKQAMDNKDVDYIKTLSGETLYKYRYKNFTALMYAGLLGLKDIAKIIIKKIRTLKEEDSGDEDSADDDIVDDYFETSLEDDKWIKSNAATFASLNGHKSTAKLLEESIDLKPFSHIAESKIEKINFSQSTSQLAESVKQKGSIPKGYIEKISPVRSFAGERELQLLRRMSTVLFFKMPKQDMVEVQTMHIRIDEKSYLFVAGNKAGITKKFYQFKKIKLLREALTKNIEVKGDKEGARRVKKYTREFSEYFKKDRGQYKGKSEDPKDLKRFKWVKTLLKEAKDDDLKFLSLKYSNNKLKNPKNILSIIEGEGGSFY